APGGAPQQMLAVVTSSSNSRSSGKPSPRSALRSIDRRWAVKPLLESFMAPGFEFGGGDRHELDSIAGTDREITGLRVGDAKRSCPKQMPAAGRFGRVDRGLAAGGRDRPGHDAKPR